MLREGSTRLTFLSGACALGLTSVPWRTAAQAATIRMGGISFSDQFQEPFLGRDSGIFAKAGLNVEVQLFSDSAKMLAALVGGAIDVAVGDLIAPVQAINAGVPITLFASSCLFRAIDPIQSALFVAKDSTIRDPRQLSGKSIAVPSLGGIAYVALQVWLSQNSVPVQSVKVFEIATAAMPPALAGGKIDAAFIGEPTLTLVQNEVRMIGTPYVAVGREFLINALYASKSWIAMDVRRARLLTSAIYDTARWANMHHNETFEILVRNAKYDADKLKGIHRSTYATSLTPRLVQPPLDAAMKSNIFKKPVNATSIMTIL